MNTYCGLSNMKVLDARKHGILELPDNQSIVCVCGRKLKKSHAGFGAGWTIPRHKENTP